MKTKEYYKEYRARRKADDASIHVKLDKILELLGHKMQEPSVVIPSIPKPAISKPEPIAKSLVDPQACRSPGCPNPQTSIYIRGGKEYWLCDSHKP